MSSTQPTMAAQPTAEVVPITTMILNTLVKDKVFLFNAIVAGLLIGYYLIFGSPMDEPKVKGKKGDPKVVLVGPSDAGKTTIFTKLVYNESPQTHTSLKPSTSILRLPDSDKTVKLSDLPGHPRLKESVQALAGQATAAVFVCDVSTLIKNGAAVAEELPAVLTRLAASSLSSSSAPIPRLLILANKSDLLSRSSTNEKSTTASALDEKTKTTAIERTKLILTREMDRLKSARGTTSGRIEGISQVPLASTPSSFFGIRLNLNPFSRRGAAGSSKPTVVSEEGMVEAEMMVWGQTGRFSWEEIEGVDVQWAASWASGVTSATMGAGDDGLEDVRRWLADL